VSVVVGLHVRRFVASSNVGEHHPHDFKAVDSSKVSDFLNRAARDCPGRLLPAYALAAVGCECPTEGR